MKVQIVDINKVVPYATNPRNNESAIDGVVASLKEFGWKQPIVVDKDYVIIVGHTRYQASRRLEYTQVPIIIADDLSEKQAKAYRIADNRLNQNATWDNDLLKLELDDLPQELIELTGFDESEMEFLTDGWESNHERIEGIEPIDGVDKDRIVIRCKHEDKMEVWEAVTNAVNNLSLEDVEVQ